MVTNHIKHLIYSEAVTWRYSAKKLSWDISQYSQVNDCVGVSTQSLSYEFLEIFQNIFFVEHFLYIKSFSFLYLLYQKCFYCRFSFFYANARKNSIQSTFWNMFKISDCLLKLNRKVNKYFSGITFLSK